MHWLLFWRNGKENQKIAHGRIPSTYNKYVTFTKLPRSLWDLDESYKNLLRELSKR